jgi:hypothetical protein
VTQTAEADHTDLLPLDVTPAAHGRVGRDPGAKQRRDPGQIEVGGNTQNKVFIDDDTFRVSAVGDATQVFVRGVEGEGLVWAQLFQAILAIGAGMVRINQTADARQVARLELRDGGTDLGDPADDLVARNAGIDRGHDTAPLVAHRVEVGMTDAAKENLDLHVVFGRIPSRDYAGSQRRCRTGSGVSFGFIHGFNLLLVSFLR